MPETETGAVTGVVIRRRVEDDLPALVRVVAAQQASSGYPHRWPLPFPVEQFVARDGQDAAWVAEVDGVVVGHVAVGGLRGEEADAFAAVLGERPMAAVQVLFVDLSVRGHGVGGRLLDVAVAHIRDGGRLPVLDVLAGPAVDVYRHRGWAEVGRLRPSWLPDEAPSMLLMALDA